MSRREWLVAGGLIAVAVIARLAARDFLTDDVRYWVLPWYESLRDLGIRGLGMNLPSTSGMPEGGNYTPPYYYLLYLAGRFDGTMPALYLIKAISVAFDIVAAAFVFAIVRTVHGPGFRAWLGFCAVLAAPTVIANGALWGQCDSIHASLMVGSVYFVLRGRAFAAMAMLGAALAVKAQAVFLFPFVLLLVLRGAVPVLAVALVPLAYMAAMLPAILLGRPLLEVLTVYVAQAGLYQSLSMNAANLYYFVSSQHYETGMRLGSALAAVAGLAFAGAGHVRRITLTPAAILVAATTSAALMPFVLPGMHDRYFFAADLLSIALALVVPRFWRIALGFQAASLLSYVPIVTDTLNQGAGEYRTLMPLAVAINVVLVAALVRAFVELPADAAARAVAAPQRAP